MFDQHSINFTYDTHSQAQFQLAMNLVGGEFVDCVREQVRVWLPARAIVKSALDSRHEVGRDCGCHDRLLFGNLMWITKLSLNHCTDTYSTGQPSFLCRFIPVVR